MAPNLITTHFTGRLHSYYLDGNGNEVRHGKFYIKSKGLFSENETIVIEANYAHGKRNGLFKMNARAMYHINYKDNKRQGEAVRYFENGQIACRAFFVDDELDGKVVEYLSDGRVEREHVYNNGELQTLTAFQYRGEKAYKAKWDKELQIVQWHKTDVADEFSKAMEGIIDTSRNRGALLEYEERWPNGKLKHKYYYYLDADGNKVKHDREVFYYESDYEEVESVKLYFCGFLHGYERKWDKKGNVISSYPYILGTRYGDIYESKSEFSLANEWKSRFNGDSNFGFQRIRPTRELRKWHIAGMNTGNVQNSLRRRSLYISQKFDDNGLILEETRWYPNGRMERQGYFYHDQKDGQWFYWNEEGDLIADGIWKEGVPWQGKCERAESGGSSGRSLKPYFGIFTSGELDEKLSNEMDEKEFREQYKKETGKEYED